MFESVFLSKDQHSSWSGGATTLRTDGQSHFLTQRRYTEAHMTYRILQLKVEKGELNMDQTQRWYIGESCGSWQMVTAKQRTESWTHGSHQDK